MDKKKRSAKRIILVTLSILLLLILLTAAGGMIYLNHMLDKINRVNMDSEHTLSPSEAEDFINGDQDHVTIAPDSSEPYVDIEDITFPTEDAEPTEPMPSTPPADIYGEHLTNILLVGQDRREYETSRQRSDTMILISLNQSDNTITVTSFMRDQYVQIPGYNPNKLNAAYAFGGMSLLSKTLDINFGVQLDGIVEVDLGGFKKVITLLGGVEVTLTEKEAKYLNDLYEGGRFHSRVIVGSNHLDAEQALEYARLREIDSDYARAGRQRNVIMGLIEAYKGLPVDEMLALTNEILPLVTTNLSNGQIIGYGLDVFPMLASAKVQTLRIPVDGTFSQGLVTTRPGFCRWLQYNIDFAANKKVLWEVFRCKD